jgi:NAD(P)-dependent dehydrogenase (short-subunit alcohol dehydrogenase family)
MPDSAKQMTDKICMVTGATSGIGAVTAYSLAQLGATVILVGRNPKKCKDAVQKIKRDIGNASVDYIRADLSLLSEVRRCAEMFKRNFCRLDVLVNNVGARFLSRLETAEGFEMTIALNYLGQFLLTTLLFEELKTSGHGRVINVASEAHRACSGVNFNNLQSLEGYNGKEAYAQSKLANILFTYETARQLKGTGITVNALEPGNVITNFSRNNGVFSWAKHIVGSFLSGDLDRPKEGAKTSIYLASSPEVEGISGHYFSKMKAVHSSEASYDAASCRQLWQVSLELTGFKPW